jgi:pimeloyl-ACP methyl ester carboxylesterase
MKEATKTRELIELDGLDFVVRGTYHKPHDENSESWVHSIRQDRLGLVFLNGLAATRAGQGDAVVYWADSFAADGYPAFRLDLPGHGDSAGEPPAECLSFINHGGYASVVATAIRDLIARFNLSGVVIVGQCSGAVSAIYSAAASRDCKGLVLLDPYFHLPLNLDSKIRGRINIWAIKNPIGSFLSSVYGRLKQVRLLLRGDVPPENANFSLLRNWKELASTGLPILIFKAPRRKTTGTKPKVGEFDYFKFILSLTGRKGRVVIQMMNGANHTFANRLSRAAVRQHTEQWLKEWFPLIKQKKNAAVSCCERDEGSRRHNQLHENYLS